ncbi:MAG: hypothetical protein L0387_00095, partial [Acidobacteria bacterium]|nr:hypothetical protein [Acidobacteriota bacterium]
SGDFDQYWEFHLQQEQQRHHTSHYADGRVPKEDIRQNRDNVAERLGFLGRLIHGPNPRAWLQELKARLGEVVEYAEAGH